MSAFGENSAMVQETLGKKPLGSGKVLENLMALSTLGEGPIPEIPDDIKVEFVNRYVKSYEMITGSTFEPVIEGNIIDRIKKNLNL